VNQSDISSAACCASAVSGAAIPVDRVTGVLRELVRQVIVLQASGQCAACRQDVEVYGLG